MGSKQVGLCSESTSLQVAHLDPGALIPGFQATMETPLALARPSARQAQCLSPGVAQLLPVTCSLPAADRTPSKLSAAAVRFESAAERPVTL